MFLRDANDGRAALYVEQNDGAKLAVDVTDPSHVKSEGSVQFTVSAQAVTAPKAVAPQPMQDYQVIDTSSSRSPTPVFEVKQVREELTKQDTGTTFLTPVVDFPVQTDLHLQASAAAGQNDQFCRQII